MFGTNSKTIESQAVHNDLLELGFVFDGKSKRYFYHSEDGTLKSLMLRADEVSTYYKAACSLGEVFFRKEFRTETRKIAYQFSQRIIEACGIWEDQLGEQLLKSVK